MLPIGSRSRRLLNQSIHSKSFMDYDLGFFDEETTRLEL